MRTLKELTTEVKTQSKEQIRPELLEKMEQAVIDLKNGNIESRAFNVGDKIVDGTLIDYTGKEYSVLELLDGKPTIINFYRGGWCPYCNIELRIFNELLTNESGINMLAISPERQEPNESSENNINKLNFNVYSDINNVYAKKFNIVFDATETIDNIYRNEFGIDLERSQGNTNHELPLPATYVVNKDGIIVFAYLDADYTNRAEPKDAIAAYKSL